MVLPLKKLKVTLAAAPLIFAPPAPWWAGVVHGAGAAYGVAAEVRSVPLHHSASCRVHNYLADNSTNVGSGTLIDVTPSGERGLVLSCAHLFAEGTGRVVVEFPGAQTHGALLVGIDRQADLAALEIAMPRRTPAIVETQSPPQTGLQACGFGPNGQFRCIGGSVVGCSEQPGLRSLRMSGAVRSGDSGGGVFDNRGRLVAVMWGESGGVTYASTGGPLARFLERVRLGNRRASDAGQGGQDCPDGRCPLTPPRLAEPPIARPTPHEGAAAPQAGCDCGAELTTIAQRLAALERVRLETPQSAPTDSPTVGSLVGLGASAAAAALGVSGPTGWGVLAAASIGSWLIGRRMKRRRRSKAAAEGAHADRPPDASRASADTEATAAAVTSFPIERDDREARELLRLSQLEGRDPLQDAVAGRLALDRLDAIAERDGDPQQATWADRLRRELRERFNDIAPTKFQA